VVLSLLAAVAVPKFIEVTKQAEASSVRGVLGNLRNYFVGWAVPTC
jgi:type II secretory pathway pseudopilin PulG